MFRRATALAARHVGHLPSRSSAGLAKSVPRVVARARAGAVRSLASIGAILDQITDEIPLKEALLYPTGKQKWTRADIKTAADGLAAGFLDLRLQPGDTIVAWLSDKDMDLHITQFAAAKAGLTLAIIDASAGLEAVERLLLDTSAKALVYAPFNGNRDNTEALKSLIPELERYDDASGLKFHCQKFPALTYLIHTGLDVIQGVENLRHIFLPMSPELSPVPAVQAKTSDKTPLCFTVGNDGSKGAVLSHSDVIQKNVWPIVTGVLNKQLIKVG